MLKRMIPASLLLTSLTSFAQVTCPKPVDFAKTAFQLIEAGETNVCDYLEHHLVSKTALNEKCETLYQASIKSKNSAALKCLDSLGYGARTVKELNLPHPQTQKSLYEFALENGDLETILMLKRAGGKTSQNEFLVVVKNKDPRVVSHFIRQGADVNAVDGEGTTALMFAAGESSRSVVELLIRAGAEISKTDDDGSNALIHAATNDPEIVKFLVAQGLDINTQAEFRRTPLWYAAGKQNRAMLEVMLRLGADVNARDLFGFTPLHQSVLINSFSNVELLLLAGADIQAANAEGENALMLNAQTASDPSSLEVAKLLLKYGINVNHTDRAGWNALHHLAYHLKDSRNEQVSIQRVRLLVRNGVYRLQGATLIKNGIALGSLPEKVAQNVRLSPALQAEFN